MSCENLDKTPKVCFPVALMCTFLWFMLELWGNTGKFQDWIYISHKYIVVGHGCDKCQLIHIVEGHGCDKCQLRHIIQVYSQLIRLSCLKLWCVYIMPVQQCPSAQNNAFVLHFLKKSWMITTGIFQLIEQLSKYDLSPSIFQKTNEYLYTGRLPFDQ
jgi:hypothetical protein